MPQVPKIKPHDHPASLDRLATHARGCGAAVILALKILGPLALASAAHGALASIGSVLYIPYPYKGGSSVTVPSGPLAGREIYRIGSTNFEDEWGNWHAGGNLRTPLADGTNLEVQVLMDPTTNKPLQLGFGEKFGGGVSETKGQPWAPNWNYNFENGPPGVKFFAFRIKVSTFVYYYGYEVLAFEQFGPTEGNPTISYRKKSLGLIETSPNTPVSVNVSTIEAWRQQHFGSLQNTRQSADLATPDGDGIPNLVKYALCMRPGVSGSALLPHVSMTKTSGNDWLALTFQRDPRRYDISIVVESQDKPGDSWVEVSKSDWGGSFEGSADVVESTTSEGNSAVTVRVPRGSAARRFIRLRVEH